MNEEQFLPVSRTAQLISHSLCANSGFAGPAELSHWLQEHPANQLLMDELADPDILFQELIDFGKFDAVEGYERLIQRLFEVPAKPQPNSQPQH